MASPSAECEHKGAIVVILGSCNGNTFLYTDMFEDCSMCCEYVSRVARMYREQRMRAHERGIDRARAHTNHREQSAVC